MMDMGISFKDSESFLSEFQENLTVSLYNYFFQSTFLTYELIKKIAIVTISSRFCRNYEAVASEL